MNKRDQVINFVSQLPKNMQLHEIAWEVEFLASIQTGRDQAGRHEGISTEEARKLVERWVSK